MRDDQKRGRWMQTFTGRRVWPCDLEMEDICIEDIAHHLSQINRYGGACKFPYSVAQHSVLVSQTVPEKCALLALLHDASEAYLGDIVSPIKHWEPFARIYMELESRTQATILEALGVTAPTLIDLHHINKADSGIVLDEARACLKWPEWYNDGRESINAQISRCTPEYAEAVFLMRYCELTGTRH